MVTMETYTAGDVWTSSIVVDDPLDDPVNPSTVAFSYSIAGATPVVYTYGADSALIHNGLGEYSISIDTTNFATAATGQVQVSFIWGSRGNIGQGVRQGCIIVKPPVIALATLFDGQ